MRLTTFTRPLKAVITHSTASTLNLNTCSFALAAFSYHDHFDTSSCSSFLINNTELTLNIINISYLEPNMDRKIEFPSDTWQSQWINRTYNPLRGYLLIASYTLSLSIICLGITGFFTIRRSTKQLLGEPYVRTMSGMALRDSMKHRAAL